MNVNARSGCTDEKSTAEAFTIANASLLRIVRVPVLARVLDVNLGLVVHRLILGATFKGGAVVDQDGAGGESKIIRACIPSQFSVYGQLANVHICIQNPLISSWDNALRILSRGFKF